MKTAKFRAVDVAQCLLEKHGPMPQLQLQKLLYYCQGWSIVWDDEPIFTDAIEAWVNGPVVPAIWRKHPYEYMLSAADFGGDSSKLGKDAQETVEGVLRYYGKFTPSELVAKTHSEDPWKNARHGFSASERGSQSISLEDLKKYFTTIATP